MRRLAGALIRKFALIIEKAMFANRLELLRKNGAAVGKDVFFQGELSDYKNAPFLTICDGATVSHGTVILLHDSALNNVLGLPIKFGKVVIGRESYIGANCTIQCGVRIGEKAIVGAHSLVTKDIPDGTVAYGVPARVVGTVQELAEKYTSNPDPSSDRFSYFDEISWRHRKGSHSEYLVAYREFVARAVGNERGSFGGCPRR